MSDRFAFERLVVRRMPGFPHGGLELDGLSPGVNIVYGPNGAGKTTTARAIEALVWPAAAPARIVVEGGFRLGDDAWRVELDSGHARHQRAGQDRPGPPLPPVEARDRYRLSLPELLTSGDADFAATIARESAGGYDLAGAARDLGLKEPSPAHLARRERRALDAARAAERDARARQEQLHGEQLRLGELRRRKAAAEEAGRRADRLELCVAYLEAEERAAAARTELERFPAGMARLHGDEAERLRELDARIESARDRLRQAERARDDAGERIVGTELPDGGLPGSVLPDLRERLAELRRLERALEDAGNERAGAERRRYEARREIGPALDDARLAALDSVAVGELAGFARRVERHGAALRALEAEAERLDGAAVPQSLNALREGVRVLGRWLAAERPAAGGGSLRAWALVAAAVAAIGIAVGALTTPLLLVLLVVPALVLVQILRAPSAGDRRPEHRAEFERLGLDAPAAWETDPVSARLRELERAVADAQMAETRAERRRQLEPELARERAERRRLDAERDGLVERIGVAPDIDEVALAWLLDRIGRWQDAHAGAGSAAATEALQRDRLDEGMGDACALLERYGHTEVQGLSGVAGAIEDLDARRQAHAAAAGDLAAAEQAIRTASAEVAEREAERAALFERLGLAPDQDAVVADWCREHDVYQEARERDSAAERDLGRADDALQADPGYDPVELAHGRDGLATRIAAAREEAGRRDGYAEEIARITALVEQASRGHDLEDALAAVERCRYELLEARARDLTTAVGATLAEWVQRTTRDHDRPAVFHRARVLFECFTRGRYSLDLDEGEPAAFRATDSATGLGHALDELSSGTRVQLLLAVRIAFVETMEQGVRLPIVLDEALGNSDDLRARAIIEAVAALARDGRQVFYFSAQPDEVAKWQAFLDDAGDVPHRTVDLARARRLAEEAYLPALEAAARAAVPEPGGMSHAEYGRALGVPAVDASTATIEGVHLWYLIDDCSALHELLSLGIETWGQLETLERSGQGGHSAVLAGAIDEARLAARMLEEALELRRVGRGRPVDRQALIDSGAITETFMERVIDLCQRLDGDALSLVEALERGEVARFRSDACERLREHLEENGYLDPRERISPERLRAGLVGRFAGEGRVDGGVLERVLVVVG